MADRLSRIASMLVVILVLTGLGAAQPASQRRIFVLSGQSGQAPILQASGKSYVDVEDLARMMNGSLGFQGNQIILTLSPAAGAATADQPANDPATSGFSQPFMKAGIEAMSVIREWRSVLVSVVQNGTVVSNDFFTRYRNEATKNVRLTSLAVTTDSDRNGLQLLSNVLDKMQRLTNNIMAARKNLDYLSPTAVTDDPLDQQILTCTRSMAAMATTGQFQDDGACH